MSKINSCTYPLYAEGTWQKKVMTVFIYINNFSEFGKKSEVENQCKEALTKRSPSVLVTQL